MSDDVALSLIFILHVTHVLGKAFNMQICTSLQTNNHASTHHSVFYRLGALPAAHAIPTNSIKALKAYAPDFSKAFNTVRHSTLMKKTINLNIPDNIYNSMVFYFNGHLF